MTAALSLLVGVGALALAWGVGAGDANRTWGIYLVDFLFFAGLAQGAVAFLAILHLTRARWAEPLRPVAEALGGFLPVALALAIPLPLGHDSFFAWLKDASDREHSWLSPGLLALRLLGGLGLLHGLSLLLIRRSRQLDDPVRAEQGRRALDRLAPAVVIAYALALTLLSSDWVMSLDPRFVSTLVGGHFFVGGLYASLAALVLLAVLEPQPAGSAGPATPGVLHDLGKLLLAFCLLWTYTLFAQYLVIWYGDLPEETGFVLRRTHDPGWSRWALATLAAAFLAPFPLLLSRELKRRGRGLAAVAALVLAGLWAERFLQVLPSLAPDASTPGLLELGVSAGYCGLFALCYRGARARSRRATGPTP